MKKTRKDNLLSNLPEERRKFLRKALDAGFIAPAVATFSMTGLMARPASAQANMS